jgi:predicted nucleic acid-binding Zn ribbon protein
MRPLNQAVPGALAGLLRAAPLSPGKVTFAWRTAVGSAVDRATTVRLEQRVLVVEAATSQWTREIARSSGLILARLQTMLGADAIERLEIRSPRDHKTS